MNGLTAGDRNAIYTKALAVYQEDVDLYRNTGLCGCLDFAIVELNYATYRNSTFNSGEVVAVRKMLSEFYEGVEGLNSSEIAGYWWRMDQTAEREAYLMKCIELTLQI